jgi:hypothetical protein
MTQTGMMLGTAYYMSPEQRADSKKIDWRTDQYALGVVLYELCTGTLPTGAVQPIEKIRRDLPKRYADALMRAMAPLPAKRFQSFDEMLAEIQAPRPKRFRLARLVLIGAAVATAFVTLNDQSSILNVSVLTTALKSELAAASARVIGGSPSNAADAGSTRVMPPVPEETPSVATVLPEPTSVPDSEPEPVEPKPAELETVALESAAPEPIGLQPIALESGVPLQMAAQSNPEASSATLLSEAGQQVEASTTGAPLSVDGGIDARRNQCIAQCERDDGECRILSRRGQQECMQALSGGNSVGIDMTNVAATSCAFFGQPRCDSAPDRDACLARVSSRYNTCVNAFTGSVVSRGQDCDDRARASDHLCLDELLDCRKSCE